MRFSSRVELLPIDQHPRTFATRRSGLSALVLCQSSLGVYSRSDIEAFTHLAFQDVNGRHREGFGGPGRDRTDDLPGKPGRAPVFPTLRIDQHWSNLVDLVGIEPTTSSMPWKRAPKLRHRPTRKGQLSYCRSSGPASQTRQRQEKTAALRAAAGFERRHVLVLVHEEELAVAEALGFAFAA